MLVCNSKDGDIIINNDRTLELESLPHFHLAHPKSEIENVFKYIDLQEAAKDQNLAKLQLRGAVIRTPFCKQVQYTAVHEAEESIQVFCARDSVEDPHRVNLEPASLSVEQMVELKNLPLSTNWLLDNCPINLNEIKALYASFHINFIVFVYVEQDEVIFRAVEEGWDSNDLPLKLAQADYELSQMLKFFQNVGCKVCGIKTGFCEDVNPAISKALEDFLHQARLTMTEPSSTEKMHHDFLERNGEAKMNSSSNCERSSSVFDVCGNPLFRRADVARLRELKRASDAAFTKSLNQALAELRLQRLSIIEHLTECEKFMSSCVRRPSQRQEFVDNFQKDFNAIPFELLQDEETKAERHHRLFELCCALRKVTESRSQESQDVLKELTESHSWYANKRAIISNIFCVMLQAELDKWQFRVALIQAFFGSGRNEEVIPEENNVAASSFQLPMLKPPGLCIPEGSPNPSGDFKSRRTRASSFAVGRRKPRVVSYEPELSHSEDGVKPLPMQFILNEELTSEDMLSLTHETQTSKAPLETGRKRSTQPTPRKKVDRKSARKKPSQPQPNDYLLGKQEEPPDNDLHFFHELVTCALKCLQMRLTEEQTKLGAFMNEDGCQTNVKQVKSSDTARSRSRRTHKKGKAEELKEVDDSEEAEKARSLQLKFLSEEAERSSLRLRLIRNMGLHLLGEFKENVHRFQTAATSWIDWTNQKSEEAISNLEKYVQDAIESGKLLQYRLMLPDNELFHVSHEDVFIPKRLQSLSLFEHSDNEAVRSTTDKTEGLSDLVNMFRGRAPHGFLCEKEFAELVTDRLRASPLELIKAFGLPEGIKHTGTSLVHFVDWRRFVFASALNCLDSPFELSGSVSKLMEILNEEGRATLVGVLLSPNQVRKAVFTQELELDDKRCDLILSLFHAPGSSSVKVDEVIYFLSAFGVDSPFEGILRALAALECLILPRETLEFLKMCFENPEGAQEGNNFVDDFEVSIDAIQKLMDCVLLYTGSGGIEAPNDGAFQKAKLNEAIRTVSERNGSAPMHRGKVPISQLLQQPSFHSLVSWMLPYMHFKALPEGSL
uniref:Protein kinase domain-containing protein n=1 Tax=Mesocestoides corti TaxID=53468 RepID=A0A5K3ERN9_MESCO